MTSLGDLKNEFYAFGIYGRDFNLDVYEDEEDEDKKGAAGALQISSVLIALAAIAVIIRGN